MLNDMGGDGSCTARQGPKKWEEIRWKMRLLESNLNQKTQLLKGIKSANGGEERQGTCRRGGSGACWKMGKSKRGGP